MKDSIKLFGLKIWERESEKRDVTINQDWLNKIGSWTGAYSGMPYSGTGFFINEFSAQTFSAVYAAVRICSETVAMLPLNAFEKLPNGNRVLALDQPCYSLIHTKPNRKLTSFAWREAMQAQVELWGNAYSIIQRDGNGVPEEFIFIPHPSMVTPYDFEGELWYNINGFNKPVMARDVIHIKGPGFDGIKGKSVLTLARDTIGSALAMQEYGAKVFKTGASKRTAIKTPQLLNDETYKRLKSDFSKKYSGIENLQEIAILEGGMEFTEIGMSPGDAQFIEQRRFSVEEIARFFRLPLHKLNHMDASTNNNIEHQGIEFATDSIAPRISRWESELDDKLFTTDAKKRFYTKFNMAGLMRGDSAARTAYYRELFNIGVFNANKILTYEDEDIREGGDKYYTASTMMSEKQREKVENQNIQADGNKGAANTGT